MGRNSKIGLWMAGGLVVLALILLTVRLVKDLPYKRQIPIISDLQNLPRPIHEQIETTLKKTKHHPSAGNLGMLGMVYHANAFYDLAGECYALAIKRKSTEWIWNYYLGYLDRELSESQAALENFNAVTKKNPGMDMAWFYAGEEYQNSGNNQQAELAFKKLVASGKNQPAGNTGTRYDYFPISAYAGFRLARLYLDSGRPDDAAQLLRETIRQYRAFGPAYRLMGNYYQAKGDPEQGNRYAIRANDLPVYAPPVDTLVDKLVLLSRSELYLLKKIDEAEKSVYPEWALKLVTHAMRYIPEDKYLISKALKLYLMTGKGDLAMPYLDKHLRNFGDDFTELISTGDILYAAGFFGQAADFYKHAAIIKPGDPGTRSNLALCLWNSGNRQQALTMTLDMTSNPADLVSMTKGITLLMGFNETGKAKQYLASVTRLAPANPVVLKLQGMAAEQEGNTGRAISFYESACKADPADLTTIRNLGGLFMKMKMWNRAIEHFRKSLGFHPNEPYLLERLGTLLVSCPDKTLRNVREGLEYSERAFIHTGSHSSTLISAGRSLAVAYAASGDRENAAMVMQKTIQAARRENLPAETIAELERLLQHF